MDSTDRAPTFDAATPTASVPRRSDSAVVSDASGAPSPVSATAPESARRRKLRNSHKKSKTGCRTCKRRKIKCDEHHPICLNCIRSGAECAYVAPAIKVKAAVGTPHDGLPSSAGSTQSDDAAQLPWLELELVHNFTARTYATLSINPEVQDFWRVTVPEIGLSCDYIMRAVLAVSALHLACHRPDRRELYLARGMMFHQQATRTAMPLMNDTQPENAPNLFLFSCLTMYFALASPRGSDGFFFKSETGFPEWTFLIRGTRSLRRLMKEKTEDTPHQLHPLLKFGELRWVAQRDGAGRNQILGDLRQRVASSVQDAKLLRIYGEAIDLLELSLGLRDENGAGDIFDAMIWLFQVSDDLVPLLRSPAQEAVVIFSHFCLVLKRSETQWWLQGWADHIMSTAYGILDVEHKEWIRWPMEEVGWRPARRSSD